MNLSRIRQLEETIDQNFRPVHPFVQVDRTTKWSQKNEIYCEVSIVLKLRSDEEVNELLNYFSKDIEEGPTGRGD